ncbi:TPA: tail fiber assembly protein [Enterobacter hormaechei subsp. xiangfangensis]|nr:tail fiber assembly protein [Enterobacter hormaechei subsp. xiangfangensis]HAV1890618.1 tail fiber assembly protein [Enterobacter hormaechei subsp. xiangfangensis]
MSYAPVDHDQTIHVYYTDVWSIYTGQNEDVIIPAYQGLPINAVHVAPPTVTDGKAAIFDSMTDTWSLSKYKINQPIWYKDGGASYGDLEAPYNELPPDTIDVQPPAFTEHHSAIWSDDTKNWTVVDDWRNIPVWNITNGSSDSVLTIGPLPSYLTPIEPPFKEGFVAIWDMKAQNWKQIESHIGETVWSKETGEQVSIDQYGPLPDNVTTISPPEQTGSWHVWDEATGGWKLVEDHRNTYCYSKQTGDQLYIEKVGPIPDGYTLIAPPERKRGTSNIWDETANDWKQIEDWRGDVVYKKSDASGLYVYKAGPLPSNLTGVEPPTPQPGFSYTWDDTANNWTTRVDYRSTSIWNKLDASLASVSKPGPLPASLTDVEPPEAKPGKGYTWDDALNGWKEIEDYRNTSVWYKDGGTQASVSVPGPLPADVIDVEPPEAELGFGYLWLEANKIWQKIVDYRQTPIWNKADGSSASVDTSGPLPSTMTDAEPPATRTGYGYTWDNVANDWKEVEDHRGSYYYNTTTGQQEQLNDLGPIPSTLTKLNPADAGFLAVKWDGSKWVEDAATVLDIHQYHNYTEFQNRMLEVSMVLEPIMDAVQLGTATDAQKALIPIFQQYRLDLLGVNMNATNPVWPHKPERMRNAPAYPKGIIFDPWN